MGTSGVLSVKGLCRVLCKTEGFKVSSLKFKVTSVQKTKKSLIPCGI